MASAVNQGKYFLVEESQARLSAEEDCVEIGFSLHNVVLPTPNHKSSRNQVGDRLKRLLKAGPSSVMRRASETLSDVSSIGSRTSKVAIPVCMLQVYCKEEEDVSASLPKPSHSHGKLPEVCATPPPRLSNMAASGWKLVYQSDLVRVQGNAPITLNSLLLLPIPSIIATKQEVMKDRPIRFELWVGIKKADTLGGSYEGMLGRLLATLGSPKRFPNSPTMSSVWETIELGRVQGVDSKALLGYRVGFPDRLISVSVPNNTKEIDPLEWRSAPFFAGPTLRGLTYAPVSKGFQASVSDPNIQTNHHKGAENAGLMMSEDAKKKISRRAKGDGTTDLMEFREEMAEMPLGLLVPSLYLRQAESELYTTCEGYLQRFNKELNLVKKLATSDFALTQGDFQSPKYQETITKLEKMMQENFYRGKERIMEMKQIEAFYVDQWYAVVQGKSTRDLRKKNAATPLSTGGKGGSLVLQENQELVKQSSGASLEFISSTESGDMDEEDLLDVQEVQLRKAYADELHVNNADLSMLDNNTDLSQDQANLLSFRKSTSRKDTRLRFLPINMHLQVLTVRETTVQAKALPKISASNNLRTRLKSIASVRIGERTSSRRHLTEQSTEPRAQSKRHLLDAPPPTTAPPPATAPKRRGLLKFVGSTRDVNNPQLDEPPAMPEIEEPNQEEDITNREESFFYDTLSAGAPAAHALTSKYGGCWQQLKELTKNREDFKRTRDDAKSDLFTKLEAYRKYKEIEWMLTERVDVVLPQALSILAGAVLGRIYVMAAEFSASVLGGFEAPDDEVAQSLITHGFLVGWESLLSTHGKEMAMLGDLFYAVRYLNDHIVLRFETFVQDPAENEEEDGGPKPTSSLVDDALNVRLFKTTTKQEHDIYESADRFIGPGGSTDDAVWLLVARIPTTVVDKLPKVVRTYIESHQGTLFDPSIDDKKPIVLDEVFPKPLKWTCVLFTQGINEMQNIANMMGTRVLQEEINEYSCGILVEYCVKRFQVAPAKMDKKEKRKSKNALDKNGASSQTKEAQMKEEERLRRANIAYQQSLVWAARLRFSVKNQTQAGKSFEILQNSADLVRWLSGVRIASCKSAKDRTAMSLTWEEARILHNIHFVRDVPLLDLANLFREHGTRLINVHKNTGVPRYAFNKAQRSFLPDSYRPPMSTIGSIFGGNLS